MSSSSSQQQQQQQNQQPNLLSEAQQKLLAHLGTDFVLGRIRHSHRTSSDPTSSSTLSPPIHCPSWACILLPCIPYLVPSLSLFRQIEPKEAEVLVTRYTSPNKKPLTCWIRYDASGLQVGDIVRISQGEVIAADIVLLSLYTTENPLAQNQPNSILIDYEKVTGQTRPVLYTQHITSSSTLIYMYCGGTILQGSCIGIVVATGKDTITNQWIQQGLWPPQPGEDLSLYIHVHMHPQEGFIEAVVKVPQPPLTKYQQVVRRLGYRPSWTRIQTNAKDEEKLALNMSDVV